MPEPFLTIEKYTPQRGPSHKILWALLLLVVPIIIIATWVVIGLNIGTTQAAAGVNHLINYQGKIASSTGIAIPNGNYGFRFEFWNSETGGGSLGWSESWTTANPVPVREGIFSVALGSLAPIPGNIFYNNNVYLEVSFDSDGDNVFEEVFTPRKRIMAAPYALNAEAVGGYKPSTTSASNTIPVLDALGGLTLSGVTTTGNFTSHGKLTILGSTSSVVASFSDGTNNVDILDGTYAINAGSLPSQFGTGTRIGDIADNIYTEITSMYLPIIGENLPAITWSTSSVGHAGIIQNGLYLYDAEGVVDPSIGFLNASRTITDSISWSPENRTFTFSTTTIFNGNTIIKGNVGSNSPADELFVLKNLSGVYSDIGAGSSLTFYDERCAVTLLGVCLNSPEYKSAIISSIVEANGYANPAVYGSGLAFYTSPSSLPVERMRISSNGNVGIGTTTPTVKFEVWNGNGTYGYVDSFTGAWANASDISLKKNIFDLNDPLQTLLGLRPVRYDFKSEADSAKGNHIGFIVQEVETVLPEVVSNAGGLKAISYAEFAPLLVGAIKQQQMQIKEVNSRLAVASSSSIIKDLPVTEADPQFKTLRVTQAADFIGTITVRGEANFESRVTFKKPITLSPDSAGTAMIKSGEKFVEVKFSESYETEPKVVANLNNDDESLFISYKIANKTKDGFKIVLASPAAQDLNFDWLAFAAIEEATSTAAVPPTEPLASPDPAAAEPASPTNASGTEPAAAAPAESAPAEVAPVPSADPVAEPPITEAPAAVPQVLLPETPETAVASQ